MEKRPRGRPRKYRTTKALLEARRRWAKAWRLANPERWKEIQRKADAKRRGPKTRRAKQELSLAMP
jgi:hypothetical protein